MPELAPLPDPAIRRGQLLEAIKVREQHIAWLTAQQRLDIAALSTQDRGGMYARYVADELAMIWRRSPRQARNRVDAALVFADFPVVHGLIGDGTWLLDHADAALDELVGSGLTRDQQHQVLDLVLSRRTNLTPWEVRQAVRTACVVLFPEHATERARKAEGDRDVRSYPDGGGASLIASGPTHLVAAMMAALDALTWPPPPDDPRTVAQRRFDTLVDLVCGRIQPDNWLVHVLVELATLQEADAPTSNDSGGDDTGSGGQADGPDGDDGGDDTGSGGRADGPDGDDHGSNRAPDGATDVGLGGLPGEIPGFGPIPAALARELARTAVLRRVVVDQRGRLVAVEGRVHRPDLPVRPIQSDGTRRPAHPGDVEPDPITGTYLDEITGEEQEWLDASLDQSPNQHPDPDPDPDPEPDPDPASDSADDRPPDSESDNGSDNGSDGAAEIVPDAPAAEPTEDELRWYEDSIDRPAEHEALLRSLSSNRTTPAASAPSSATSPPTAVPPAAAPSLATGPPTADAPTADAPTNTGVAPPTDNCPPYGKNRWSIPAFQRALQCLRNDPIRPLDLSSDKYVVPKTLRRHLELRDRTCVFPGCPRLAATCDKDHLLPWPRGATSETNLANECDPHHHGKHEYFSVERLGDGTFRWTSPAGITVDRPPRPLLEAWTYRTDTS